MVRLATDTANNDLVALKIMQKEWIWRNDMSSVVRREIDIMRELDHPCVVKLVEVFNSETHVFMAMEAVDGRELHAELMRYGRVDETRARDLFQQLMVAVEYLHSIGVAHRDLKLENVMLSDDGGRLKVTNFGLAARLGEWEGGAQQKKSSSSARQRQWRQQTACDTPAYAAPEVIGSSDDQRYDARGVDTWCAGVCLYAIVTGSLPFQGSSVDDTLDAVRTQEPKLPEHLSPMLTDLLRGMLHKDPSKRLGVPEVLSHPWTLQQQNPDNVASPLQPGEIEDQEDLAEAARLAIREARLAASEAERAAAAAQAAETNAAKALAAVKLASTLSASRPGAVRPAIKRSSSVGSSSHHNHRRSASVDSRYDGPGGVAAEATAVRQDQEWSSGGGRDRTWSADDSVCAGAAGGGGGGAAGDLQNEGYRPPPPPPSSEPALVSPLGTAATTPPAVGSAGTVPGQPPPASGLHRPEHIPSSPGLFLVTPASSSTSQPPAEEDSPVAGAEQQQQKPGNNAWVGSWGSSSGVLADGDEAVSRRTAGPGSVAAPCGELLPAEDGGAVSRGGASESSPCEGPGERDGAELPLASDMARDTGAEESVDEEANGAPIKQPGENFTVEAPPSTSPPAAEKEAEKAEGPPPVLANGVEKDPSAEDSGATAVAAAAAAAAAAATATVEKLFNDTAAGDPQAGSSVTATAAAAAAASPSVGAGAVRGAGAVDGVAADGDGDVLSPAAAPADTETTSAKTRPLLRSTPVAEAPLTKATGASNKSDDAPVATAVPYTKSDLPAAPTALHGGGSQETRQAQAPLSSPSEAREVQESATTATTTEEPKAPQHPPPSTSHGALAGEASDDTSPATTGDTAVPASATETATASPRASGVKNNEEKEVPGTSPQEPREPSAEAPAEAAESAAVAGREHRAVASNSAEAAADEDETVAETAAGRTGEEGRVESSTSAEGAVPVAAGGKGRPVSTAGVAVGKAASAPVPGGAVGTPTTSLEGKVTDAEHPVSTDATAGDESGLPLSPPSYEDLFSGASEEEGGGAKDEDATGDTQGEGPAGAGAGHAVDEKRGEVSVSAPTMVTQPAQRPAELGVEEEEEEEEDEEEQGGEHSAGRSPTRGAVVWEAINPFAGDAGGGGGCGDTADDPSSSRSAAASRGGGTKRPPARVYQPSTFKELMTGIKETQTAEDFAEGAGCDDDDAESRYRGDEQEGDDGGARAGEGVRAPAAATNIRKLAEAESIWGTGPADAGANEETPARRAVSGKYLRNNGQIRPQSLQRPQGRGRQGERGKDRPVSTEPQRHSITPAGYALGRPSAVCESSVDAKPAAGTGLEKADKAAGKQAAVEPRKRGKSIGKKISRIFGRKTAVK